MGATNLENAPSNAPLATTYIANNAVTSAELASDASVDGNRAVTTNHLRDLNVTSGKLANGAVGTTQLAANSVTSTILASDAAVDANRAVQTNHIRDLAVTSAKLANDAAVDANRAVTTNHIKDAQVTLAKMAAGSVDNTKLVAQPRANVSRIATANLTPGTPTYTPTTFDTAYWNVGPMWALANPQRLTFPWVGLYKIDVWLNVSVTFLTNTLYDLTLSWTTTSAGITWLGMPPILFGSTPVSGYRTSSSLLLCTAANAYLDILKITANGFTGSDNVQIFSVVWQATWLMP